MKGEMRYAPSNNSPEVSVLVPIYNAEQYLTECLDSILGQSQRSMEVICINDGSNDNSLEIIERSASEDPRVVVLNKENSGYGDSLNQGLERAQGTYVGIIEPDDFVDKRMYQKLFAIAVQHDADIVKSDFFECVNGLSRKVGIIPASDANRLIAPIDNFSIFKAQPSIWSAIYARAFLSEHDILFTDSAGASFQDTAFNLKTLATSDKVWLTQAAYVYYRRDNAGSSIHSNDKVFAVCDEYDAFEQYMESYPARMVKIAQPLQAVRFETYSWNLSRLSGQAQQHFYSHMHERFVSLRNEGLICYDDFPVEDVPLLELLLNGDGSFIQASTEARALKFGSLTNNVTV
jgi:glycosyltransferase involved in cell wall biosynthesis